MSVVQFFVWWLRIVSFEAGRCEYMLNVIFLMFPLLFVSRGFGLNLVRSKFLE